MRTSPGSGRQHRLVGFGILLIVVTCIVGVPGCGSLPIEIQDWNDLDAASNSGGWQWAASVGCDAQPWFRIFNPVTQSERFDPHGKFIRRYLPELARVPDKFIHAPWTMPAAVQQESAAVIGRDYRAPIVEHKIQREKALALFRGEATRSCE